MLRVRSNPCGNYVGFTEGAPYKIWFAQTRVAEDVDPYGRSKLRWKWVSEDVDSCEMVQVFGTSKALFRAIRCGFTGRRGRRPLRRCMGARVVWGVEWRGFSGCRMYRAVRDAADFWVVEDADLHGRRNLRWKLVAGERLFLRDGAFSGRRGRRLLRKKKFALEIGRRGRRPLRRCAGFRNVEGAVSREKIRIFGSSRTSTPTRWY